MNHFILNRRDETPNSTWGDLIAPDGRHLGLILERGPHNAEHPRIPAGEYKIVLRPLGDSKFDKTLAAILPGYRGIPLLCDVPGRSNVEIHPANVIGQLEGCLAPGTTIVTDQNGDFAATASRAAYGKFYPALIDAMAHSDVSIIVNDYQPGWVA